MPVYTASYNKIPTNRQLINAYLYERRIETQLNFNALEKTCIFAPTFGVLIYAVSSSTICLAKSYI